MSVRTSDHCRRPLRRFGGGAASPQELPHGTDDAGLSRMRGSSMSDDPDRPRPTRPIGHVPLGMPSRACRPRAPPSPAEAGDPRVEPRELDRRRIAPQLRPQGLRAGAGATPTTRTSPPARGSARGRRTSASARAPLPQEHQERRSDGRRAGASASARPRAAATCPYGHLIVAAAPGSADSAADPPARGNCRTERRCYRSRAPDEPGSTTRGDSPCTGSSS